jgi:hypothetical protein
MAINQTINKWGIQTLRDKAITHFVFGRAGFPKKNLPKIIFNKCVSISP